MACSPHSRSLAIPPICPWYRCVRWVDHRTQSPARIPILHIALFVLETAPVPVGCGEYEMARDSRVCVVRNRQSGDAVDICFAAVYLGIGTREDTAVHLVEQVKDRNRLDRRDAITPSVQSSGTRCVT
jgi:hypothetical protein